MIALSRILLATDFSERATSAARFARALAESNRATLYVLHVGQPFLYATPMPTINTDIVALPLNEFRLTEELKGFVRRALAGIHVPVVAEVRSGSPARVIAHVARARAVDLIVLGKHTRCLVSRLLVGSVSKAVLEHACCPVLMVPLTMTTPQAWAPDAGDFVASGRRSGAI